MIKKKILIFLDFLIIGLLITCQILSLNGYLKSNLYILLYIPFLGFRFYNLFQYNKEKKKK